MDQHTQSGIATVIPMIAGMVRDTETGELRWPMIASGIIVAATIAIGGFLVKIGNEVAANTSMIVLLNADLRDLKTSLHPATAKRYTSDDAARDNDIMRARLREIGEENRRGMDELARRVQRMEDKRK